MTHKQQKLLEYIEGFLARHGRPPSFRQMADHMGVRSVGNIGEKLHRLERDGHIRLRLGSVRSLEVMRHVCPHCGWRLDAPVLERAA